MSHTPYAYFSRMLREERRHRGFSSSEMAKKLEMSEEAYKHLEGGEDKPKPPDVMKLTKIFNKPFEEWAKSSSPIDEEETVAIIDSPLGEKLEQSIEGLVSPFRGMKPQNGVVTQILHDFRTEFDECYLLPSPSVNLFLILETLSRNAPFFTHLKNYPHPFFEDQTLVDFIALDPHLAFFCLSGANQFYFWEDPASSFSDALNRMDSNQFKELLYVYFFKRGIYENPDELGPIQFDLENAANAALLAQYLEPHLKNYLNPSHVYMAALFQHMGKYAVFTILKPIVDKYGSASPAQDPDEPYLNTPEFVRGFFPQIVKDLKSVAGAILAQRLKVPEPVQEALLELGSYIIDPKDNESIIKEPLTPETKPLVATVRILNTLVKKAVIPDATLDSLLKTAPQVKISKEVLLKAVDQIKSRKSRLIEASSTMAEETVKELGTYNNEQTLKVKRMFQEWGGKWASYDPEHPDFRFDPKVLQVIAKETVRLLERFKNEVNSYKKDETDSDYATRMTQLRARIDFVDYPDLDALAEKRNLSPDKMLKNLRS